MGLLRDFLERRHQDQRDQAFREYDTYKSILTDNRPIEQGGFSDEQKQDALQRIVGIAAPSKKHATAILPLLQGLTGIGQGNGEGDERKTGWGGVMPGLAGGGPVNKPPKANGVPDDTGMGMAGPGVLLMGAGGAPDASSSTYPNDVDSTPSTSIQPPPQSQPRFQPPPSAPAPTPARPSNPRGSGIFASPTFEERTARAKEVFDIQTQNLLARAKAQGMQDMELAEMQRNRQVEWMRRNPTQTGAYGHLVAGFKPPSGAFTAETNAKTAGTQPVNQSAYISRINPETNQQELGWYSEDRQWHSAPGAKLPEEKKLPGVEQQQRDDLLAAYAAKLGKTLDQLTPQEKVDAISHSTGPLKQIEDAKRVIANPNSTPEQKAAAELYLKGVEGNQKRTEVTVNLGQARLDELKAGDIPVQARNPNLPPNAPDEGVLAKLEPIVQSQIKMLANYELPVTAYMLTRGHGWAEKVAAAKEYNPAFDPSQYDIRKRVRTMFTTGKPADNIRAINTVIGHMGSLRELATGLQNGDVRLVNMLFNRLRTETGNAQINNFQMAAKAVVDELANVFKASGVTDQSVRQWEPTLTSSQAPDVVDGALMTGLELVGSRIGALSAQWHNPAAMGETPFQFVSPKAMSVIQQFGVQPEKLGLLPQDMPTTPGQAPGAGGTGGRGATGKGGAQLPRQAWQTPPRPGAALDNQTAQKYLGLAGGDNQKARDLAKSDGWVIP